MEMAIDCERILEDEIMAPKRVSSRRQKSYDLVWDPRSIRLYPYLDMKRITATLALILNRVREIRVRLCDESWRTNIFMAHYEANHTRPDGSWIPHICCGYGGQRQKKRVTPNTAPDTVKQRNNSELGDVISKIPLLTIKHTISLYKNN